MLGRLRIAGALTAVVLIAAGCSSAAETPLVTTGVPTTEPAASQDVEATTTAPADSPDPTPSPTATPTATPSPTATPAPTATPSSAGTSKIINPSMLAVKTPLALYTHGQYLMYRITATNTNDNTFYLATRLTRPDGTGGKLVSDVGPNPPVSPPRYIAEASWSKSGGRLHIVEYPNSCTPHIYYRNMAQDAASSAGPVLTNHDFAFIWSPDDTKIAYMHFQQDTICQQNALSQTKDLMLMKSDGSGKQTIKASIGSTIVQWYPDASGLLAVNAYDEWQKLSLTTGLATPVNLKADDARISPDGTKIAYVNNGHVYVRPLSGGGSKDLGAGEDFAFSPSSQSIAICSLTQLAILSATTGVGLSPYSHRCSHPTWSPDGQKVAFLDVPGGIRVMPIGGGPAMTIAGSAGALEVAWQP